ncbi:LemA family protein [Candidatus Gracilibacteria bacterium]|nr:LemA family protein [Candidatus Gracilibacteria bacterium]
MKKTTVILILVVALVLGGYSLVKGKYNNFIVKDESVQAAWGQVENQYQRRYDLIPNLVETVKGYATHEQSTFQAITEARAKVGQMNVDVHNAEQFAEFQSAQAGLSSALSRLMVVVENYPDLKANQNFLGLQTQLEGTENRIATERMRYNDTVKDYNIYVRQFPNNLFAGFFGFTTAELFQMTEGAETVPQVQF